jgi:hypothetical protein
MWLILARPPHPDARWWPGRRGLAAMDAVAWPLAWIALAVKAPIGFGVVGLVVVTIAMWQAIKRLHCAVVMNHRYRFTTWRWGSAVVALLALGWILKLAAWLT